MKERVGGRVHHSGLQPHPVALVSHASSNGDNRVHEHASREQRTPSKYSVCTGTFPKHISDVIKESVGKKGHWVGGQTATDSSFGSSFTPLALKRLLATTKRQTSTQKSEKRSKAGNPGVVLYCKRAAWQGPKTHMEPLGAESVPLQSVISFTAPTSKAKERKHTVLLSYILKEFLLKMKRGK